MCNGDIDKRQKERKRRTEGRRTEGNGERAVKCSGRRNDAHIGMEEKRVGKGSRNERRKTPERFGKEGVTLRGGRVGK